MTRPTLRRLLALLTLLALLLGACQDPTTNPITQPDPDDGNGADTIATVDLDPDTDTTVALDDGAVTVHFPAGGVEEATDITVSALAAADIPEPPADIGDGAPLAAVRIDGLSETSMLVSVGFRVPDEVAHPVIAHHHDGVWSVMPSFLDEDGRLSAMTRTFSTFVLTSREPAARVEVREAPGFTPERYGVHVLNTGKPFRDVEVFPPEPAEFQGFCYGMAETAALYYLGGTPTPGGRSTEYLSGADRHVLDSKTFAEFIRGRQALQGVALIPELMSSWFFKGFGVLDAVGQADDIFRRMGSAKPVIFGFSDLDFSADGFHHALLAYRAVKRYDPGTDTLQYVFWVYDPNGYELNETHGHYADLGDLLRRDPATITIDVARYEATRWNPFVWPDVSVTYDIASVNAPDGPSPKVFGGFTVNPFHAGLPWTNPEIDTLWVGVDGGTITALATASHPSDGASMAHATWDIYDTAGPYEHTDERPMDGWQAAYTFSDLEPGDYVVSVMVQDAQGNWSRAQRSAVTVHATRIEDIEALTPPGTAFRPFEDLRIRARVVTDLPEVLVGAMLPTRDGTRGYWYLETVSGPDAVIDLRYGIAAIATLDPLQFESATIIVRDASSGEFLTRRTVPIDYRLTPQEPDLWLGWWDGSIAHTIDPDLMTDLTVLLMSPVPGHAGTGTIRTYDRDGQTDVTARGTLTTSTLSSTQLAGTLTCQTVSGTLYGWPASSCYDLFSTPQSGFTATRGNATQALVTVDALAADDPAFRDIAIVKRLQVAPSGSAVGVAGAVHLQAPEAAIEGPGSACAPGLGPCPVLGGELGE